MKNYESTEGLPRVQCANCSMGVWERHEARACSPAMISCTNCGYRMAIWMMDGVTPAAEVAVPEETVASIASLVTSTFADDPAPDATTDTKQN